MIFLDNAAIHKSKALKKFLAVMGKQIRVYHFTTYTPELYPAELISRSFRKTAGNRLYEDAEEMQKSISIMAGNKIRTVKTFAYLTC